MKLLTVRGCRYSLGELDAERLTVSRSSGEKSKTIPGNGAAYLTMVMVLPPARPPCIWDGAGQLCLLHAGG